MPELPEVESIRRVLAPQIQGLLIFQTVVNRPDVIAHPTAEEFCDGVTGQLFNGIQRRGKYLIFRFRSGKRMVLHLRMTGCLLLAPVQCPEERHTHVVFRLNDGKELRFSDMRRFGRIWLLDAGEPDTYTGMGTLGLEPFDSDFTADYLSAKLGGRRKAIKECLMEQTVIAGIGNIYSDEILFSAGIHPARPANSLTTEEWARLAATIPKRLSFFVQKNETTPEEYWAAKGKDYRNTPYLQVYGHAGTPCPACGTVLRRMVLGGRSSVFCPNCQSNFQGSSE